MTQYALVQENIVKELVTFETEEELYAVSSKYQAAVDLTNVVPKPRVGWIFNVTVFTPPNGMDVNDLIRHTVLRPAVEFGKSLTEQFTVENIAMGVTQAGKTSAVGALMKELSWWLSTGSLYEAYAGIQAMISAGVDPSLSPFVTVPRLEAYKAKILAYIVGPH